MKVGHWFGLLVVILVSYYVGTKYPNIFGQLKSTVTGA